MSITESVGFIPTICNCCGKRTAVFIVPRDCDLQPDLSAPSICLDCFETFCSVLRHLPPHPLASGICFGSWEIFNWVLGHLPDDGSKQNCGATAHTMWARWREPSHGWVLCTGRDEYDELARR